MRARALHAARAGRPRGCRRHCLAPSAQPRRTCSHTHAHALCAVRCEPLDIGYIDGMLILPLIIEHTIGECERAGAGEGVAGAGRVGARLPVPQPPAARPLPPAPHPPTHPHPPPTHPDERSPLCGHTHDSLQDLTTEIVVTFEGTTEVRPEQLQGGGGGAAAAACSLARSLSCFLSWRLVGRAGASGCPLAQPRTPHAAAPPPRPPLSVM